MAFKLIWSPSAKYDLKDLTTFIAEDSPSAAKRFVMSLFQTGNGWLIFLNPVVSCLSSTSRLFVK